MPSTKALNWVMVAPRALGVSLKRENSLLQTGSGGKACLKAKPAWTQRQAGVEAPSKPQASTLKSATPRVCSHS